MMRSYEDYAETFQSDDYKKGKPPTEYLQCKIPQVIKYYIDDLVLDYRALPSERCSDEYKTISDIVTSALIYWLKMNDKLLTKHKQGMIEKNIRD